MIFTTLLILNLIFLMFSLFLDNVIFSFSLTFYNQVLVYNDKIGLNLIQGYIFVYH